jgi:hypothetical protein
MKARVKNTGEIGIVTRIDVLLNDDFVSVSSNEVEILQNYADATIDPDYWTRLEHTYAGMAMQGMIRTVGHDRMYPPEKIAIYAEACAQALVEKMKNQSV